jgi:hypothetical protein
MYLEWVLREGLWSLKEIRPRVVEIWEDIYQGAIRALTENMHRRYQAVIRSRGENTHY